jgi:hypothetical protein
MWEYADGEECDLMCRYTDMQMMGRMGVGDADGKIEDGTGEYGDVWICVRWMWEKMWGFM